MKHAHTQRQAYFSCREKDIAYFLLEEAYTILIHSEAADAWSL